MFSEVVQLTRAMVRIPSVNPQEKTVEGPPYGEARIAEFVCDWFKKAGLDAQKQIVAPNRENVWAQAAGNDPSRTLVLCAHTDTVDVKDMTVEPFAAAVADGRIYGRGACDDKGPLAAMMIAFRDRLGQGDLPFNLALLATCGEEYNLLGSGYFARHLPKGLIAVVVAEPTDLQVVTAHKGVVRLTLSSTGKSAHSSRPHQGKNAIYTIARAITAVERFAEELKQGHEHPQLGHEIASVTIVNGGQQINVIPDRCTANIDWRVLPGRDAENCRAELAQFLLAQVGEQIDVEVINQYKPMETDAADSIIELLLEAARKATGKSQTKVFSGATDASSLAGLGIPTPIFGPGGLGKSHTADEYIDIDKLEQGVAAYKAFLDGPWR